MRSGRRGTGSRRGRSSLLLICVVVTRRVSRERKSVGHKNPTQKAFLPLSRRARAAAILRLFARFGPPIHVLFRFTQPLTFTQFLGSLHFLTLAAAAARRAGGGVRRLPRARAGGSLRAVRSLLRVLELQRARVEVSDLPQIYAEAADLHLRIHYSVAERRRRRVSRLSHRWRAGRRQGKVGCIII